MTNTIKDPTKNRKAVVKTGRPPQIVASQIDDHYVFRCIFFALLQLSRCSCIRLLTAQSEHSADWQCSRDHFITPRDVTDGKAE